MKYVIYKQLFRQSKTTCGTLYCYTSALCEVSVGDQRVTEINFMRNQNEKVGCIGSRWVGAFVVNREMYLVGLYRERTCLPGKQLQDCYEDFTLQ